jgi:hypothetical protein
MELHLFGATTPSGEALRQLALNNLPDWPLLAYSRQTVVSRHDTYPADFKNPASFQPCVDGNPAIWISFGPIWLLAPFLEQLATQHGERLIGLKGLITCSSTSALTKRFAANRFDRELVARLTSAEDQLLATCRHLKVPCRILRPTLIYGQMGPYGDRNLSRLLQLMRRLPILLMPANTGLRQPIHAIQLAGVALALAKQLANPHAEAENIAPDPPCPPDPLGVGGDETLSYTAMIKALQMALAPDDPARRCLLLPVPNRLFFVLATPLLLASPKAFEAVLRIAADLAGFTPSHRVIGESARRFPVLPLA